MRRGGGTDGARGKDRGDTYEGVQGEEARLNPRPLSKYVHVSGGRADKGGEEVHTCGMSTRRQ